MHLLNKSLMSCFDGKNLGECNFFHFSTLCSGVEITEIYSPSFMAEISWKQYFYQRNYWMVDLTKFLFVESKFFFYFKDKYSWKKSYVWNDFTKYFQTKEGFMHQRFKNVQSMSFKQMAEPRMTDAQCVDYGNSFSWELTHFWENSVKKTLSL